MQGTFKIPKAATKTWISQINFKNVKKKKKKTNVGKNVEKRGLLNTAGGNQIGTVTMQNNMEVPQETKNRNTT